MFNLNRALAQLRSERNRVQQEMQNLDQAIRVIAGLNGKRPTPKISAAGRARIAAAQRARWAKVRKAHGLKPKRTLSQAARQRIAAAQRARWAKYRVEVKKAA